MTIHLKKDASKKEIAELVKKANPPAGKGFNVAKYFGKINWGQDPIAYQRELRGNE